MTNSEPQSDSVTVSLRSLHGTVRDAIVNYYGGDDDAESEASDIADHVLEWVRTNAYTD